MVTQKYKHLWNINIPYVAHVIFRVIKMDNFLFLTHKDKRIDEQTFFFIFVVRLSFFTRF